MRLGKCYELLPALYTITVQQWVLSAPAMVLKQVISS